MAQLKGVQYQHPPIIIVHFILGPKILKMTATDSGTIFGREFVDLCMQLIFTQCMAVPSFC